MARYPPLSDDHRSLDVRPPATRLRQLWPWSSVTRVGRWLSVCFWAAKRLKQTSQPTVLLATFDPLPTFPVSPAQPEYPRKLP
jgi:hypothetical protein